MIKLLPGIESGLEECAEAEVTTGSWTTNEISTTAPINASYSFRIVKGTASALGSAYKEFYAGRASGIYRNNNNGLESISLSVQAAFTIYHLPQTLSTSNPTGIIVDFIASDNTRQAGLVLQGSPQNLALLSVTDGSTIATGFSPTAGTAYRYEFTFNSGGCTVRIYTVSGTTLLGFASCPRGTGAANINLVRVGYQTLIGRTPAQEHAFDGLSGDDATVYSTGQWQGGGIGQILKPLAAGVASGAGTYAEFTSSSGGANYTNIDDALATAPATLDDDYNTTVTGTGVYGTQDTFAIPNAPAGTDNISAVSLLGYSRGIGGTIGANHQLGMLDGGTWKGVTFGQLSGSFHFAGMIVEEAPSAAKWTDSLYNGCEMGYARFTGSFNEALGSDDVSQREVAWIVSCPFSDAATTAPVVTRQRSRGYVN